MIHLWDSSRDSVTTAKLFQTRNGISGAKCSPKHYTQSTVTNPKQCIRSWHNIASGTELMPVEVSCTWPQIIGRDQTYRYYVMRWSSLKHYWHVTLRLYIIAKRTAMDSQPLLPQLSMLYVHMYPADDPMKNEQTPSTVKYTSTFVQQYITCNP